MNKDDEGDLRRGDASVSHSQQLSATRVRPEIPTPDDERHRTLPGAIDLSTCPDRMYFYSAPTDGRCD